MRRSIVRLAGGLAGLALPLAVAPANASAPPATSDRPLPPVARSGAPLHLVARFGDDFRMVGVGVLPDGRVFATAPANDVRSKYSVVALDATGAMRPFPDADWNRFSDHPGSRPQWINVQALWGDEAGHLWALDSSLPHVDQTRLPPKLVEFDGDKVLHSYGFAGVVAAPDALNDVRIDLPHHTAYLTNAGNRGSLVVLDLDSGAARQVLVGDRSTRADPDQHLMLGGQVALKPDGKVVSIQADGIALSPDRQWLYYRPLSDHHYWRIATAALRDPTLSPAQLAARVQDLGQSVLSGGLIMSADGTLIGGDLEHRAIVAMRVEGTPAHLSATRLATDPRLSWADGFALRGQDLFVADSRLWEVAFRNGFARSGPFAIYRLHLPAGE